MEVFGFGAMLARMNYITRWGLMRGDRAETLSEHSLFTAVTAHLLAELAAGEFAAADVKPERVAVAALYHDISEILTGDLPTPVKYRSEGLRDEYKKVERESAERLCAMLPKDLEPRMRGLVTAEGLSERERRIVKAADKLSALVKCVEERRSGNREFESAEASTLAALRSDPLPETEYYIEHFLPAFERTLDQLLAGDERGE